MDSASENSDFELSPKRAIMEFPKDTPEWGRILFNKLDNRISAMELNFSKALDFATQTAKQAMDETKGLKMTVDQQAQEIIQLKSQVQKSETNFIHLQEKVNNLENQSRRDNLLFYGVREMKGETDMDCRRKIYNILVHNMGFTTDEVDNMKVVRCHRKGKFVPGRQRPIIIKMHWFANRERIFERRDALHGTSLYVNEDFSDITESRRKKMYPIVKASRKIPAYKNKVKIQVDRLMVKGRAYTVDQLTNLPEDLKPVSDATVMSKDMAKFFGKDSPFSNFYECPIKVDNIPYHSVEQFYQSKKAEAFDDDATAGRIMAAKTARECYELGCTVKKFEETEWRKQCDVIMKRGLETKFAKDEMKKHLLDTENRTIVECNGKDMYWSCGYYPGNPYSNDPSTWKGQNKLGRLLMDLRQTLRSAEPVGN